MSRSRRIGFVTGNLHKFQEAHTILSQHGLDLKMMKADLLEIQADDLAQIAVASIRDAQNRVSGPIIVEDAGLFVEALNGFPGPYSAYVYRTLGCEGILRLLEGSQTREAEFHSVIAYTDNASATGAKTFLGVTKGRISKEMRGAHGFGFDPIFIPTGLDQTFAEVGVEEKNRRSHRAHALKAFASWYLSDLQG